MVFYNGTPVNHHHSSKSYSKNKSFYPNHLFQTLLKTHTSIYTQNSSKESTKINQTFNKTILQNYSILFYSKENMYPELKAKTISDFIIYLIKQSPFLKLNNQISDEIFNQLNERIKRFILTYPTERYDIIICETLPSCIVYPCNSLNIDLNFMRRCLPNCVKIINTHNKTYVTINSENNAMDYVVIFCKKCRINICYLQNQHSTEIIKNYVNNKINNE